MTFEEALKKLNIYDYHDAIFNSNSRGELIHLRDYVIMAKCIEEPEEFRPWFEQVIKFAEDEWGRPESIYQHILKILFESWKEERGEQNEEKTCE